MNRDFLANHWYASVYEQFENQTHDVEFLLGMLARHTEGVPQHIFEVACGAGRISVPLAKAGHSVIGIDSDEQMLLRCYRHTADLPNMRCYQGDAVKADWGAGYDVVVMAGNLLINIESDMEYAEAQALLLHKAASALRSGGHLYLDFDLHHDPATVFNRCQERCSFEGADELGTAGKAISYGSIYDPVTQICAGVKHFQIQTNNSETVIYPIRWYKHIPTQAQIYHWVRAAGLTIERTFQNYTSNPVPEPNDTSTYRAVIWAKKP